MLSCHSCHKKTTYSDLIKILIKLSGLVMLYILFLSSIAAIGLISLKKKLVELWWNIWKKSVEKSNSFYHYSDQSWPSLPFALPTEVVLETYFYKNLSVVQKNFQFFSQRFSRAKILHCAKIGTWLLPVFLIPMSFSADFHGKNRFTYDWCDLNYF